MNLFVSLFLPDQVSQKLVSIQSVLAEALPDRGVKPEAYRFTTFDKLHVTLAYMEDVKDDEIDKIKNLLNEVRKQKFNLKVSHLKYHKGLDAIWARIENEKLKDLANNIKDKLSNFVKNGRDFKGHITLAKIKNINNKENPDDFIKNFEIKDIEWQVKEFVLVESIIKSDGAIYNKLESYKLE